MFKCKLRSIAKEYMTQPAIILLVGSKIPDKGLSLEDLREYCVKYNTLMLQMGSPIIEPEMVDGYESTDEVKGNPKYAGKIFVGDTLITAGKIVNIEQLARVLRDKDFVVYNPDCGIFEILEYMLNNNRSVCITEGSPFKLGDKVIQINEFVFDELLDIAEWLDNIQCIKRTSTQVMLRPV